MKSSFANRSQFSVSAERPVPAHAAIQRDTRRSGLSIRMLRGFVLAGSATLGTVAGSGMLSNPQVATAADCDCWEESCDTCGPRDAAMKKCLLYQSLDAIAGGIEKVLGLDESSGCDDFGCDDACDAATLSEMMYPMDAAAPIQAQPSGPIHILPSAPSHIRPPAPRTSPAPPVVPMPPAAVPHATEVPSHNHGQSMGKPSIKPMPSEMSPRSNPPIPQPTPSPAPDAKPKKGGSMFDALNDPFSDDEVRNYRPYRNVRPSGYLQRAGSANGYRRAGSPVRPNPGTPARKATHRTALPILNAPVRQTSAIDSKPVGSGVVSRTATQSKTYQTKQISRPTSTFKMPAKTSNQLIDIEPTNYLPSRR